MKSTKLLILLLTFSLVVACTNQTGGSTPIVNETKTEGGEYVSYIDELRIEQLLDTDYEASYAIDITDVDELKDNHSHVFIATVDTIEGVSPTIGNDLFETIPKTYGQLTVLHQLKGELKQPEITYARPGGIISIADYEKDAPAEMIKNDDQHRADAGQKNLDKANTYYNFKQDDDISLEAGKTYLFFGSFYDSGVFYIDAAQYGSREVRQKDTGISSFRTLPDWDELELKDNVTGSYEPLPAFFEKHFK